MSSTNTSTRRQWIANQAREHPERAFTTLHHFIDLEWMREAYRLTRKDGAAGIDGVTAADYEQELKANLLDPLGPIKSGSYFAPPVAGGEEAEIADLAEPRRQRVQQEAADEFRRGQRHLAALAAAPVVAPAEAHQAVADGEQAVVGDGHPVGVGTARLTGEWTEGESPLEQR